MDDDDDDTAASMREMMGFSSFGMSKKQKLNSGSASSLPLKPPSTSSNSTPLGIRPQRSSMALNMTPASLLPRLSGSKVVYPVTPALPLPVSTWNPAKLPNATAPDILKGSIETDRGQTDATVPLPVHEKADSTPSLSKSISVVKQLPHGSAAQLPPRPTPATGNITVYSKNDIRSDPSYANLQSSRSQQQGQTQNFFASRADKDSYENEVAYTSPYTGLAITRRELRELGNGREEMVADGDPVLTYFKPSFIATAQDLWGRWEKI